MSIQHFRENPPFMFAAEHGGDAVKGGGHPSDSPVPAEEAIDDALGRPVAGHAKTAGTGDPGVPGSKTNPVHPRREPPPEAPSNQPSTDEISALARQFWEDEGRPEGKAEEHWSRAEEQLRRRS